MSTLLLSALLAILLASCSRPISVEAHAPSSPGIDKVAARATIPREPPELALDRAGRGRPGHSSCIALWRDGTAIYQTFREPRVREWRRIKLAPDVAQALLDRAAATGIQRFDGASETVVDGAFYTIRLRQGGRSVRVQCEGLDRLWPGGVPSELQRIVEEIVEIGDQVTAAGDGELLENASFSDTFLPYIGRGIWK